MVQNGDNTDRGGIVTTPRPCRGLGKACQLQQDMDLALEPKYLDLEGRATLADTGEGWGLSLTFTERGQITLGRGSRDPRPI